MAQGFAQVDLERERERERERDHQTSPQPVNIEYACTTSGYAIYVLKI